MKKVLILLLMVVVGLGYQSCDENLSSSKPVNAVSNNVNHQPTPASIAVLLDKSLSVEKYGVPNLTLTDFDGFISHIQKNGGKLSVGTIGENSDKPFIALSLSPAPIPPHKPRKSDYENSYDFTKARRQYKSTTLPDYEKSYEDWKEATKQKLSGFKIQLEELLNSEPNEPFTDISNALNRAKVYHESIPNANQFTFLVSDGIDDKGNMMQSSIPGLVVLVYGSENYSKSLETLNFKRLADIDDALKELK